MYGLGIGESIAIGAGLFFLGVVITRAIFSVGTMIDLLRVIAQELRARNAVERVDARLLERGMVVGTASFRDIPLGLALNDPNMVKKYWEKTNS